MNKPTLIIQLPDRKFEEKEEVKKRTNIVANKLEEVSNFNDEDQLQYIRELFVVFPFNDEIWSLFGKKLNSYGKYQLTKELLKDHYKQDPEKFITYFEALIQEAKTTEKSKLEDVYCQLLKEAATLEFFEDKIVQTQIAKVLTMIDREDMAISFLKSKPKEAKDQISLRTLANAYLKDNNPVAAIAILEDIEINNNLKSDVIAIEILIKAYNKLGKYEKTIEFLELFADSNVNKTTSIIIIKAKTLIELEKYKEALICLDSGMNIEDPEIISLHTFVKQKLLISSQSETVL